MSRYESTAIELLVRLTVRASILLSSWIASSTILPKWVADEIASWIAVAIAIGAVVAIDRLQDDVDETS